jgi:hypothetical protein
MWTLIIQSAERVVGNELSQPFSGNIVFKAASASAMFDAGAARVVARDWELRYTGEEAGLSVLTYMRSAGRIRFGCGF